MCLLMCHKNLKTYIKYLNLAQLIKAYETGGAQPEYQRGSKMNAELFNKDNLNILEWLIILYYELSFKHLMIICPLHC